MKYFVAGFELAGLSGEGAALATGAVADAAVVVAAAAATGRAPRDLVAELAQALGGPVFVDVESAAARAATIVDAARAFAVPGGSAVLRVPFEGEGRAAIRAGVAAGFRMAAVGCVTPSLALEAAEAGAAWTSPGVSLPHSGAALDQLLDMLRKTIALLKTADSKTQVLVGPVRDASTLIDVAFAGAHAASASAALLRELGRPLASRATGG